MTGRSVGTGIGGGSTFPTEFLLRNSFDRGKHTLSKTGAKAMSYVNILYAT